MEFRLSRFRSAAKRRGIGARATRSISETESTSVLHVLGGVWHFDKFTDFTTATINRRRARRRYR